MMSGKRVGEMQHQASRQGVWEKGKGHRTPGMCTEGCPRTGARECVYQSPFLHVRHPEEEGPQGSHADLWLAGGRQDDSGAGQMSSWD